MVSVIISFMMGLLLGDLISSVCLVCLLDRLGSVIVSSVCSAMWFLWFLVGFVFMAVVSGVRSSSGFFISVGFFRGVECGPIGLEGTFLVVVVLGVFLGLERRSPFFHGILLGFMVLSISSMENSRFPIVSVIISCRAA